MRNEFILHLIYQQDNGQVETLKSLFSKQELDGLLFSEKNVNTSKEVIYRIRICPHELVKFKKKLDETSICKSIELFEYRSW